MAKFQMQMYLFHYYEKVNKNGSASGYQRVPSQQTEIAWDEICNHSSMDF